VETEGASDGRRILVAEDRADLRRALARMLADRGYQVLEAEDGADALDVARREALDLVVADVVMPRMTGPELVTELRKSRPDLKALLISAHPGHPALGARSLPPGIEIVLKPFRPDELLLRIRRLLSGDADAQA
jgi:two-component system response regulator SaeR